MNGVDLDHLDAETIEQIVESKIYDDDWSASDRPARRADRDELRRILALPVAENPLLALWWYTMGDEAPLDPWMRMGPLWSHAVRDAACRNYSWAVPDDEALDVVAMVADHKGVVDVGAGGGYWARLLAERGVKVAAFDVEPAVSTWARWLWHPVIEDDCVSVARRRPEQALLMVWPTMDDVWARSVEAYHQAGGRTVIAVGETGGGCTGSYELWERLGVCERYKSEDGVANDDGEPLDALFEVTHEVHIPQWGGLHDYLVVCKR